ncbi:hypothetical protein BpHYR1_033808 [Brachionus plicatilis]|uniref:Uncharacterized protein n=1 Tax=Brachionus plicatilis TaxID=10195 RepID=A0A3M7QVQ5_BRAPC|nr:hypothetical protein BpHYR1_033808 [Brachionus plicatilis]
MYDGFVFDSNKMSIKFLIDILKFCNTKFNFVSPHKLDILMSILNLSLNFQIKILEESIKDLNQLNFDHLIMIMNFKHLTKVPEITCYCYHLFQSRQSLYMYSNTQIFYSSTSPLPSFMYQTNECGSQVYTTHPERLQMNIASSSDLARQQRELTVKKVKENYPSKFALVYSCLIILVGIAQIALQIVTIVNNGALARIGSGIWGGIFCITLGVLALSLIKWKNYCLIISTYVFHTCSIVVLIFAFLVINAISLYFYYIFEYNKNMLPITVIMLILGLIAVVLSASYLVMMCKIGTNEHRRILNYNPGAKQSFKLFFFCWLIWAISSLVNKKLICYDALRQNGLLQLDKHANMCLNRRMINSTHHRLSGKISAEYVESKNFDLITLSIKI